MKNYNEIQKIIINKLINVPDNFMFGINTFLEENYDIEDKQIIMNIYYDLIVERIVTPVFYSTSNFIVTNREKLIEIYK